MLKNLKKMLVLIPCMIFGLFLITNASVDATEARMVDVNKVVVGQETKENTYYFTVDRSWSFKIDDIHVVGDWDTFLKYRVISPDGKATGWSEKQKYVDKNGEFHIGDYSTLNYSETVDLSSRNSVVPAGTYYVDIKYFASYLGISWDQNKDETIKVVFGDIDSFNFSEATITYNDSQNEYTVVAAAQNENGVGYSLVKNVYYYFSEVAVENKISDFLANQEKATIKGSLDIMPASRVESKITGADAQYKYLYVMVVDGNDNGKIISYNLDDQDFDDGEEGPNDKDNLSDEDGDESGLYDFNFGELILLVLVVVLIVSCALIITQKIVDYKKRLY